MNSGLGNSKFNSIRILLDYEASSSNILGKHAQKMRKKKFNTVQYSTHRGDFYTNYISKVEKVMPKLSVIKIAVFNFHLDGLPGNHR